MTQNQTCLLEPESDLKLDSDPDRSTAILYQQKLYTLCEHDPELHLSFNLIPEVESEPGPPKPKIAETEPRSLNLTLTPVV